MTIKFYENQLILLICQKIPMNLWNQSVSGYTTTQKTILNPASIYLFNVNNGNTRTMCEICSKLTRLMFPLFYLEQVNTGCKSAFLFPYETFFKKKTWGCLESEGLNSIIKCEQRSELTRLQSSTEKISERFLSLLQFKKNW